MQHHKSFEDWGNEKQKIHESTVYDFSPRVREIVFAKMGVNIGFESDGKKEFLRPVIILKKIGSLYWVVPLTSKLKENIFHHTLKSVEFEEIENSVVMLSQGRIVDKKRFTQKIGEISWKEYHEIQKKMKKLYFSS
jgi:mRNA-degrading endonuclease toxin of MazEF toxin-antitoxin module